jgi:hypothetical protein
MRSKQALTSPPPRGSATQPSSHIFVVSPMTGESSGADFDIDFKHDPHLGYEPFGLPLKIHQSIAKNRRPTIIVQREELHHALATGNIEWFNGDRYNPALIHYW